MARSKSAQLSLGLTGFDDPPPVISEIHRPIPFPSGAIRKRVVVERPTPEPVRRVCPTCGAIFDDYTKRANTLYCRSYCRVRMSEIKRDAAMESLAAAMGTTADLIDELFYAQGGLKRLETMLNQRGYHWDMESKSWLR